jgi:two-component system cell cycle sensor histidine kinase/response regulator CckA
MKSEVALTLENAGWPVLLVNSSGAILRANPAAVKTFGPTLEGEMPLSIIWASENGHMAEQFLLKWVCKPSPPGPLKFCEKGGAVRTYVTGIYPVTEDQDKLFLMQLLPAPESEEPRESPPPKDATAESLAQKQKLDCAMQLARTVSLDFNNALTSILGHASLLLTQADASHPMRHSLLEVEKAAARAAEIASDLSAFSRQETNARAQTARNLNSILQRAVQVFESSEGKRITWNLQLERKPFAAKSDEAKMQQAFAKILENAVQSIKGSGQITVQSRNVEFEQGTQDGEVRLAPGAYICVEISDTGSGIEKDVLPRIFEPFFTTKGGKHRGLGLALVYGIVTNHGGGVAVSSEAGSGTSVRMYLPAEKRMVSDQKISGDLKGSQTVLMVDDEDLMLTMGQTVLSTFGYEVLTANSGQKAVEVLTNGKKKIDLIITDLVMPGMSGRELVDQVRKISPEMRILCTSGYVPPPGQTDESAYIQKPFTSQELLAKVKQVLAGN